MKKYGTETMAETMCRFLGVDPQGDKISSREYFKGNKVSFDRSVVGLQVDTDLCPFHSCYRLLLRPYSPIRVR